MTAAMTPTKSLFTCEGLEGAQAVLRKGGTFKQVPLFRRDTQLFAKWGGGYIALKFDHKTSEPSVVWDHIEGCLFEKGPLQSLHLAQQPVLKTTRTRKTTAV